MTAFLERAIAPRGLGFALTAVVIATCCRIDNSFMLTIELYGATFAFMASLVVGAAVACVAIAFVSLESPHLQAAWMGVGTACAAVGVAAVSIIEHAPTSTCAVVGGAFLGIGLVMMTRQWLAVYAGMRIDTALVTASISFLLVAILEALVRQASGFFVTCFGLLVCIVSSGLVHLAFSAMALRRERLAGATASAMANTSSDAASAEASSASASAVPEAHPFPRWIAIFAAAGLLFGFFTWGLTFYPASPSDTTSSKLVPYVVVAVFVFVSAAIVARINSDFEVVSIIALAIGAAIALATPFVDSYFDPDYFPMSLLYLGFSLFNVFGFALVFLGFEEGKDFSRGVAVFLGGCVVCLVAGLGVYHAFGENGQAVSLCLMTIYLVALVAAVLRSQRRASKPEQAGAQAESAAAQASRDEVAQGEEILVDKRELACEAIAERYALSPREAEVMEFLTRGYGTSYIAVKLFISSDTVRTHCKRIYEKCGVHTKEELIELVEAAE